MINLHNMDCMVAMKEMRDNQFDLAITDPPYFDGVKKLGYFSAKYSQTKVKRQQYKSKHWKIPTIEYFKELQRVSKNQIIWGINYYNIRNIGTGRIIWDKKNDASTFSDCEIAYSSLNEHVKMFRYMWNGMLQENMKNKEVRIHPTQKPVALYKWLLQNYAKQGDAILDTHLGSGSIAIACHDDGFDLTGYELDEDYFNDAKSRLERHQMQLTFNF